MINGNIDLTENKDFKRDTEEKIKNLHDNEIIPWSKESGNIVSDANCNIWLNSFPQIYRVYYSDTDMYDEASMYYRSNIDALFSGTTASIYGMLANTGTVSNNINFSCSLSTPYDSAISVYYDGMDSKRYVFNYSPFNDYNTKKKESVFPVKERYNKMVSIKYLKHERVKPYNKEICYRSIWANPNPIPWKSREVKMLSIGGFDVKPERKERRISYKNNNSPIPWLNNLTHYVYNDYMEELRNDKEKDYLGYLTSNWFHAKG